MKVKICGIDSLESAKAAQEHGADFIGFIFAQNSPRKITGENAKAIADSLRGRIGFTGVFLNQAEDEILKIADLLKLDAIQLHGEESDEFINRLKEKTKAQIWKAVWLESDADIKKILSCPADILVCDSAKNALKGGSGEISDWSLAAKLAKQRPIMLAGGISAKNVKNAFERVRPYGMDANSALEDKISKKSASKIKEFMDTIKNARGRYGIFGGQYVAETLIPALFELEDAFGKLKIDKDFNAEFNDLLKNYVGRPSPLYYAKRLSEHCGGAKIWLKREDLNHTGAHKINNALGQALIAKRMGKPRLIAETGAGMHGVATATAAALLGMQCDVFMGTEDIERQAPNVARMKMLGARLIPVSSGTATLKDAMNEALRDWVATVENTFYVIGTAAGPHPYPEIVRHFQSVIGTEARCQSLESFGALPNEVVACVGGGSNAIGLFCAFIGDKDVAISGAEAGGCGIETKLHAASLNGGNVGVLHGNKTFLLQDEFGQIQNTYSVSAGLDYPGVGPEHAHMFENGRAKYTVINDKEAVETFQLLCRLEGIIPALESAHAIALAAKSAKKYGYDKNIVVCLSGRGDKDMDSVVKYLKGQNND